MRTADVVVVGAGVIGASTAFHLAQRGLNVTLLDRGSPPASATASGASAGGVRQQDRQGPELPLALEAIGIWQTLDEQLGAPTAYRRNGMVICASDAAAAEALRRRVRDEREIGLDVTYVEGDALHSLVPDLSPAILAGSYCPSDGDASPLLTVKAWNLACARLGVSVRHGTAARGVEMRQARVEGVRTDEGVLPCRQVVVAAGAWSPAFLRGLGFALPLRAGCIQMMITAPTAPILGPVLGWRGISLKQLENGKFLIGGGWPGVGDPEAGRADVRPESVMKSAAATTALIPRLAELPVIRAWTGNESWARDDLPIIDALPGVDGLFVAAGFSGHGFALSPAVGRETAAWLATGQQPPLLRPFGLRRFEEAS